LTPENLLALIDSCAEESYGSEGSTLAEERAQAIARYNGELWGDEIDGRSHLVSTELRDTVETVVPQLNRIFLGGDQICEFDPETPEDVPAAKQESRYVNFVVTQRNPAFQVFGTWFRDALLCKNGYVKAWWEERTDVQIENYHGLTDDQFNLLLQDQDVEVVEHSAEPIPQPPMQQLPQEMGQQPLTQPSLHSCKVRKTKAKGYVRFDNVPGEEIRVHNSTRGPDLKDAIYVEHRTNKTLSEIRQMGYDVPDNFAGILDDYNTGTEASARDRFDEISSLIEQSRGGDPSTKRATFREVWLRVDMDGDGIAELRKVCLCNREILHEEEAAFIPIACITPVIQPHRHIGYGYYDFLKEIEKATTAMLRSFFDSVYLANNGRYGINVDNVNIDDMLISRPGGIVRVKGAPGENIFPITHPVMGDAAMNGLNFLQNWKKAATGVMADSQSLSADVLNNSTATGISQAISVWQARVEGVARCFAETGMTDLFRIVHALTQQNATSEEKVQLAGQWVSVDPREWAKRTSLTVTVGLGTGSKEAKIAMLMQKAQMQQQGLAIGIANPQNIYETAMELEKEMGYKDGARFWTDPSQNPPPEPQKDPMVQAEEIKGQVAMQTAQMKAQTDMQMADKKAQNDMVVAQQDAQLKLQIEQFKAQLDAQTKLAIAEIEIAAKKEIEVYKIQSAPVMTDGQNMGAQ
jgi:hypothetical protein